MKTFLNLLLLIGFAGQASASTLAEIGEASGQKGEVFYSTGKLIVTSEEGTKNPIVNGSTKKTKDMQSLTPSLSACRSGSAKINVQLDDMRDVDSMAFFTNTSLGQKSNVNVAVVRIKKDEDPNVTFNFKPIEIRVYDGEEIIAKARIEDGVYPCALVVGSFIPKRDEQQLALSWISPGGSGYTAGVTVYSLQ